MNKMLAYCCLIVLGLGCKNEEKNLEYLSLKKEIKTLEDSLSKFQNLYYHFRKVKTIADPRDSIFEVGQENVFNCYMAAYEMASIDSMAILEIEGESTRGNVVRFEKINGDIKMHYTPKFKGPDTIKLGYIFKRDNDAGSMYFPMNLKVNVR